MEGLDPDKLWNKYMAGFKGVQPSKQAENIARAAFYTCFLMVLDELQTFAKFSYVKYDKAVRKYDAEQDGGVNGQGSNR